MAKVSAEKLIELVRASGLDESDQTAQVVAALKKKGDEVTLADPERLAQALIDAKILTRWQCDRLLEGRHRGFFLKQYKLMSLLGTGGMSSVYLGEHVLMQRLVAIKVLPASRIDDTSYLARFRREAQAAASLDHRNIVRAYDIDNDNKNHFIVMEFVEGRDLQAIVKADGPLEYDSAAEYMRQAADGLEHAHRAGLIHRDIKPANLLLDTKGTIKVLDMGLARFVNETRASLTIQHDENVLGTADYLSPEQARDSHEVDARTDIYSLGCTLYFLLSGRPPFPEGSLSQRIIQHQTQNPTPLADLRPDVPKALAEACTRMMAKSPHSRFQTAHEVSEAMSAWLAGQSGGATGSGNFTPSSGAAGPTTLPRRSASSPKALPRREKTSSVEDTISDMDHNTIKGGPIPRTRPAAGSDLPRKPAGSDLAARTGAPKPSSGVAKPGGSKPRAKLVPPKGSGTRPRNGRPPQPTAGGDALADLFAEVNEHPSREPARSRSGLGRRSRQSPKWIWIVLGVGILTCAALVAYYLLTADGAPPVAPS